MSPQHMPVPAPEHLRGLAAENAWLRAALETARDEARLARDALRMGSRQC